MRQSGPCCRVSLTHGIWHPCDMRLACGGGQHSFDSGGYSGKSLAVHREICKSLSQSPWKSPFWKNHVSFTLLSASLIMFFFLPILKPRFQSNAWCHTQLKMWVKILRIDLSTYPWLDISISVYKLVQWRGHLNHRCPPHRLLDGWWSLGQH